MQAIQALENAFVRLAIIFWAHAISGCRPNCPGLVYTHIWKFRGSKEPNDAAEGIRYPSGRETGSKRHMTYLGPEKGSHHRWR